MTIAEIRRAIDAKEYRIEYKRKEQAHFDYIHAQLVGKAIGCYLDSSINYPKIEEVYTELFKEEEVDNSNVSAERFMRFANSFNKHYKEGLNNE